MSPGYNVIGWRKRPLVHEEAYGFLGRQVRRTKVDTYRWVVDGQDLAEWIGARRQGHDPVSPVEETAWLAGDLDDARDRVSRLVGEARPDLGSRTALLTCPVCGGLGCGAFSAEIVFDATTKYAMGAKHTADGRSRTRQAGWRLPNVAAVPTAELGHDQLVSDSWPIRHFSQSNPSGPGQGEVSALLRRVADSVAACGAIEVHDIVFHSELDDEGEAWPSMTVYFHNAEETT